MSIVNGSLDLRQELLDGLNLTENPFAKVEPPEAAIDSIFVGRVPEMRAAAMRVVDRRGTSSSGAGTGAARPPSSASSSTSCTAPRSSRS